MGHSENSSFTQFVYRKLIDPILNSSHASATSFIEEGERILDVACGNGTLAFMIGEKAKHVSAIDLDKGMIDIAIERVRRDGVGNVAFRVMDATDLSEFADNEFDTSTISMALHQFSPETGLIVLQEMMRVSKKIVVVDYNFPMPVGIYKAFTYLIERIAGGDHYRNFIKYMSRGGLDPMLQEAGLIASELVIRGKGVLRISHCHHINEKG